MDYKHTKPEQINPTKKKEKQLRECIRQYKYFDKNIIPLIQIYGGRYVLISDCKVIDSDTYEFELAKRAELRSKNLDLRNKNTVTPIIKIPRTLEEYLEDKKTRDPKTGLHVVYMG